MSGTAYKRQCTVVKETCDASGKAKKRQGNGVFVQESITSSSDTLKFLNTCLACLRDSLLRSASVPVTVFCFRICGELVLESS